MAKFGMLLLIVSVGISALVQIFTDPRITRKFVYKSLAAMAVLAVQVALGVVVLAYLIPRRPGAELGATVAFVGWLGLGILVLIRFAPHLRTPPAALLRFGLADVVCLLMITFGLVSAAGLIS